MSKYPLCERAGLRPDEASTWRAETKVILAEEVERMLSEAPVVSGNKDKTGWIMEEESIPSEDTHTARLVMIEPIKKEDTAEDLLREWIKIIGPFMDENQHEVDATIYKRARKLLEAK